MAAKRGFYKYRPIGKCIEVGGNSFAIFTTGRVDTDRQGTKDTKKRKIQYKILSVEGQCLRDPHFSSVYSVVKFFVSTEIDTLPLSEIQPRKAHAHIEKEPRQPGMALFISILSASPDMVQLTSLSTIAESEQP